MNQTQKIHFLSDDYQLEAVIEYDGNHYSDIGDLQGVHEFAIICHPHPVHGGTMNNKVVFSILKACISSKIPTLRFNFRGVGNSEGTFDDGRGEMQDLQSAIDYICEHFYPRHIRLGGFSFGSYIALQTYCSKTNKEQNIYAKPIIIAPPVGVDGYDFESLNPGEAIVVIGKKDEVVDAKKVNEWVFSRSGEIDYVYLARCEHFFHRNTTKLKNSLKSLIGTSPVS